MNLNEAIAECENDLAASRSPATRDTYAKSLRVFLAYLQDAGLPSPIDTNEISMKHFAAFPAWLKRQEYSSSSSRVHLAAINYLLEWLEIQGLVEPTHRESVNYKRAAQRSLGRHESRLVKSPKPEEVAAMLSAVRALDLPSPRRERDLALILFLYSSGCRNAEAASLRVGQVDISARSGALVGKGSKERVFVFSSETAVAFEEYWAARGNRERSAPVFARHDDGAGKLILPLSTAAVRAIVRLVKTASGIDAVFTPHSFRHAFGTTMLRETGNLALVQDLMGHANPTTTRIYAEIAVDDMIEAHHEVYK